MYKILPSDYYWRAKELFKESENICVFIFSVFR